MEQYQERVVEERKALEKKSKALGEFIDSDNFDALGDTEQGHLACQLVYMLKYLNILEARIAAFPISEAEIVADPGTDTTAE